MSEAKKIILATFTGVVIFRLGDNGYDEFVPSTVSFNIMPEDGYKTWIIARANNNGNLVLNAIAPKNMAISLSSKEQMVVSCGKMPSTTYANEETGKLIPTLWKFCLPTLEDRERFVFLLNAARKKFDIPMVLIKTKSTVATKRVLQKRGIKSENKKQTSTKALLPKKLSSKKFSPKKNTATKLALTIDLANVDGGDKENKIICGGNKDSDVDSLASLTASEYDSPQFAQS